MRKRCSKITCVKSGKLAGRARRRCRYSANETIRIAAPMKPGMYLASWLCCLSVHSTRHSCTQLVSFMSTKHSCQFSSVHWKKVNNFLLPKNQEQTMNHPFPRCFFSSQDIDLPLMKPPPPKPKMSTLDRQNWGKVEGKGGGRGKGFVLTGYIM